MKKPIEIVGGGLAGLTLAIGLRQRSVPVQLFEAGQYPRHKVCGEFISGRGQTVLEELGLLDLIEERGARRAESAAFFSASKASSIQKLESPALCISRFDLDELLARRFQELGGELRCGERLKENYERPGIVRATGRRAQAAVNGWKWFGLKTHAKNVELAADLEMHLTPHGYVGICMLRDGEVNICGLFRRKAGTQELNQSRDLLLGSKGTLLNERLGRATYDENAFCSVAGLSLQRERATERYECSIGESVTMTPPVTGNGMSMAFESASIAIEPLALYSEGKLEWVEARHRIANACDEAFRKRLAWAGLLQRLMFVGRTQNLFVRAAGQRWLWKFFFEKTR